MTTQQDNSREADRGSSTAGMALVVVALVLAFLVGRFTAGMGRGSDGPHDVQDSDAVLKEVDAKFKELSHEGKTWDRNAQREFVKSVSGLSQAGQIRELAAVAAKINKGELKVVREPQAEPKPACSPPPCMPPKSQK
jgi:hypothetical protein